MRIREVPARTGDDAPVALRAIDVHRGYRQGADVVVALRGVSLTVGVGEFVAIMGPSGSGKSTLLHLLGGLDTPDRGTVVVAGRALTELSDEQRTIFRRRRIGVVFQAFNLVPDLTAEENVALPLMLDGLTMRAVRTRVADALGGVGMALRRSHCPAQLSGGEQQRIAIARALVIAPAVLLADEPTGSLDSRTAANVLGLLQRAAKAEGSAVVMVTHDASAAGHADRIVHVVDGTVAAPLARAAARSAPILNGDLACRTGS
jgi:putative ABC transport system ATP-binding protein